LKKIPKQQLKFVVYQNKAYGFLLQVPITLLTLSKQGRKEVKAG
jgi:hypothetical protein